MVVPIYLFEKYHISGVNPYIPQMGVITEIKEETSDVKSFRIKFRDERLNGEFTYIPGQFVELSIAGFGESPISISSSPTRRGYIDLSVRRVGALTTKLYSLSIGDYVGLRGPFGNGYPIKDLLGRNLLLIGGGIGIAPLRSLILFVLDNIREFGEIDILYWADTPQDIIFRDLFEEWRDEVDTEIYLTVDRPDRGWRGNVGAVTKSFDETGLDPKNTSVVICGPPIMIKFAALDLLNCGFSSNQIIVSLERLMKCGVGMCGHCCIGGKYTCQDGPIFTYKEVEEFLEGM